VNPTETRNIARGTRWGGRVRTGGSFRWRCGTLKAGPSYVGSKAECGER